MFKGTTEPMKEHILQNIRKVVHENMAVGTGGFTSAAAPEGPVAGYDKVMSKPLKRRLKKVKDVKKDGR